MAISTTLFKDWDSPLSKVNQKFNRKHSYLLQNKIRERKLDDGQNKHLSVLSKQEIESLQKSKNISKLLENISFIKNIDLTHQQEKHFGLKNYCDMNSNYRILSCGSCKSHNFYRLPCGSFFCENCRKFISNRIKRKAQTYLWNCSHYFSVFTLPTEIRSFVKSWKDTYAIKKRYKVESPEGNKIYFEKIVNVSAIDLVYKSVAEAIKQYNKKRGYKIGFLLLPHSYGSEKLNWNFHINALISSKAFDKDNNIVNYQFNFNEIRTLFKKCLEKNFKVKIENTPQVTFAKKGGSIYVPYKKTVGIILDYFRHIPIGWKNIKKITPTSIHYQTSKSKSKNKTIQMGFEDFFERIVQHIPPSNFRTLRAYGLYSNKSKDRLKYPIKPPKPLKNLKCKCCKSELTKESSLITVTSGFIVWINPKHAQSIFNCYDFDLSNVSEIMPDGRVRGQLLVPKGLKPPSRPEFPKLEEKKKGLSSWIDNTQEEKEFMKQHLGMRDFLEESNKIKKKNKTINRFARFCASQDERKVEINIEDRLNLLAFGEC